MHFLRFMRPRELPSEYQSLQSMVDLGLQEVNSAGVILSSCNRYERSACLHLVRAAQILEAVESRLPPSLQPRDDGDRPSAGESALRRRIPKRYLGLWEEFFPVTQRLAQQPPHEDPDYSREFERALPRIRRILEDGFYEIAHELKRVYKPASIWWSPLLALSVLVVVVAVILFWRLDPDLSKWRKLEPQTSGAVKRGVPAETLAEIKKAGTRWDAQGNTLIPKDRDGLTVEFDSIQHAASMEVSFDHNDDYRLDFMQGSTVIAETTITSNTQNPGLQVYTIGIPQTAAGGGFDKVRIVAVKGDGSYSVGHLVLR